jgi:hypothetical protein
MVGLLFAADEEFVHMDDDGLGSGFVRSFFHRRSTTASSTGGEGGFRRDWFHGQFETLRIGVQLQRTSSSWDTGCSPARRSVQETSSPSRGSLNTGQSGSLASRSAAIQGTPFQREAGRSSRPAGTGSPPLSQAGREESLGIQPGLPAMLRLGFPTTHPPRPDPEPCGRGEAVLLSIGQAFRSPQRMASG